MIRALRDFVDIHEVRFIPITAESIIYDEEFDNICKFYKVHKRGDEEIEGYGYQHIIGETKDQKSEIRGLYCKECGEYKSGTS